MIRWMSFDGWFGLGNFIGLALTTNPDELLLAGEK